MDFYGDINLLDNEMQKMVMQTETTFPEVPTVGRIIFVNKRVYICVELISGLPTWVPLTNEINTYLHNQSTASATWSIAHNLKTATPLVQIYDSNQKMIIPDEVTIVDNNNVTVTLGTSDVGRAVIMFGDLSGGEKNTFSYTHTQTNTSATWVVTHNLGYYPVVRVFLNTGEEIQPTSIVHDSLMQTTITFSSTRVGTARFV